jgi:predicted GNAT family acetyltransferase/ferredoxin
MHRLYETDDLAVFWDSEKCRHEKKCREISPRTFDPMKRPWIDLTKAPTSEVWQAVSSCPSGALTCVYTHGIIIEFDEDGFKSVAYDGDIPVGKCEFQATTDGWVIYHTEVNPEYGGKGIAKRLVYKVVEAAEKAGQKILATCSYAAKVLK